MCLLIACCSAGVVSINPLKGFSLLGRLIQGHVVRVTPASRLLISVVEAFYGIVILLAHLARLACPADDRADLGVNVASLAYGSRFVGVANGRSGWLGCGGHDRSSGFRCRSN